MDDLGTRLLGVRYTDTRMRTHWFAPGLEEVQAGIDKAVGTREARIVSWNRDFTVLLVRVGNASNVGQYFVFTMEETQIAFSATDARYSPSGAISRERRSERQSCCAHIVGQLARTSRIEPAPEQLADFRRLGVELVRQSLRIVAVTGKLGFEVVDLT